MAPSTSPGYLYTAPVRIIYTRGTLSRYPGILWVLIGYLALLIIPWALLCVLTFRPIAYGTSYGKNPYSGSPAAAVAAWSTALHTLLGVQAVLAIPVASYFLARGAVVFAQRRGSGNGVGGLKTGSKELTAQQMMLLADRGWERVWRVVLKAGKGGNGQTTFVWYGAILVLLSAVTPLLRGIFISTEDVIASTCTYNLVDRPNDCRSSFFSPEDAERVGREPEPGDMLYLPLSTAVHRVTEGLTSWNGDVDRPFVWKDNGTEFVTAMRQNVTTGVLRYHALRLNSSVGCNTTWNEGTAASSPACTGERPFQLKWTGMGYDGRNVTFELCVPGKFDSSPWPLTRDRVDIQEEMFMYLQTSRESSSKGVVDSWSTTHCTSNTSRGYFELGSVWNGNQASTLLDKWPSNETMVDFHDRKYSTYYNWRGGNWLSASDNYTHHHNYSSYSSTPKNGIPNTMNTDLEALNFKAPGPLMTTALAIFGNTSWFAEISRLNTTEARTQYITSACRSSAAFPMLRTSYNNFFDSVCREVLHGDGDNFRLPVPPTDRLISSWLDMIARPRSGFGSTATGNEEVPVASDFMKTGTYLANLAMLQETAAANDKLSTREIWYAAEAKVVKPRMSKGGMITISVLVFLQAAMLVGLVAYTLPRKKWTKTLDGLACARVGAAGLVFPCPQSEEYALTTSIDTAGWARGRREWKEAAALRQATVVFAVKEDLDAAEAGTELAAMGAADRGPGSRRSSMGSEVGRSSFVSEETVAVDEPDRHRV